MVRGFVVGVASAAIAAAGLTGCSSDNKSQDNAYNSTTSKNSPSSAVTASSGSVTAAAGAGTAAVSIDGQSKDIQGQIACTTVGDKVNIAKPFEIKVTCP